MHLVLNLKKSGSPGLNLNDKKGGKIQKMEQELEKPFHIYSPSIMNLSKTIEFINTLHTTWPILGNALDPVLEIFQSLFGACGYFAEIDLEEEKKCQSFKRRNSIPT